MVKNKMDTLNNPDAVGADRLELGKIVTVQIPAAKIPDVLGEDSLTGEFMCAIQQCENAEARMDKNGLTIRADADEFRKLAWQAGMDMDSLRQAFVQAHEKIEHYEQSTNIAVKIFNSWRTRFGAVCTAHENVGGQPDVTLTIKKYGF